MSSRELSVRPTSGQAHLHGTQDLAPLTVRQVRALSAGARRQLAWGLPAVAREVRRWRALAAVIPDAAIRADALDALRRKRGQTDGAALFTILPRARSLSLLRTLVAYQILWDFLDSVGERAPSMQNGQQLNRALIDAFDPGRPLHDYYRHHPWCDDGGYLQALVRCCRTNCKRLPSFERVRKLILREAHRTSVLAINHDTNRERRVRLLKDWAHREFPYEHQATWFELTAAASAGLHIFALLAHAAEESCNVLDVARTLESYFPWPGALATMLDSYVDQSEDTINGNHIYFTYYPSRACAVCGTAELVRRTLQGVRALPNAHKHLVIVASMIAMYLSKDSARAAEMRRSTRYMVEAGGSLTRVLVPILRLWRMLYKLRSL